MPIRIAHLARPIVVAVPALAASQPIERCEGTGRQHHLFQRRMPRGHAAGKGAAAGAGAVTEAQKAAQANAAREAEAAQQMAEQRRSQQTATAQLQQQGQQQQRDQRSADCAYLQGEIQSVHRMRNMMVNRPFYSLDDLEKMNRHAEQLTADYHRVCG